MEAVRRRESPYIRIERALNGAFNDESELAYQKIRIAGEIRRCSIPEDNSHIVYLRGELNRYELSFRRSADEAEELIRSLLVGDLVVNGDAADITELDHKMVSLSDANLALEKVEMVAPSEGVGSTKPLLTLSDGTNRYLAFYSQIDWHPVEAESTQSLAG